MTTQRTARPSPHAVDLDADPRQLVKLGPRDQAPLSEVLLHAVASATLAPSVNNAQPWRFRMREDGVDLYGDRTRLTPAVDPAGRELVISCGAALHHLTVALRARGLAVTTRLLIDVDDPELLATVRIRDDHAVTQNDVVLDAAIARRRTNREPFDRSDIPTPVIVSLVSAAYSEGAALRLVEREGERSGVAHLVAEGERAQCADPAFRAELATWTRSAGSSAHDGIPGHAMGFGGLAGYVAPFAMRNFDLGRGLAPRQRRIVEDSPAVAVLLTSGDSPVDWLRAGSALSHVLLLATAAGVSASFLNQPVEVRPLRVQLRDELSDPGFPQSVLRLGYDDGPLRKPTPRRPLRDVLLIG